MIEVLNISIPFFALILLGYLSRTINFMDVGGAGTMSKFAFYITLPPFMFLKIASNEPAEILNWDFLWRFEICTTLVFLSAAAIGHKIFRLNRSEVGIFGLNVAYPNYGYIGIPLSILAFGDGAALPIGLILFADTIVLLTLTSFFVSDNKGGGASAGKRILLNMVKNPLVLAVAAGLMFGMTGLKMPSIPTEFGNMLAGAAAPVALFALGATLYGQPLRAAAAEVSVISLFKLVLHPLIVVVFFISIPGVDTLWVKVAILSACLPVAANVFMLANHYGAYIARSASAILASTVIASGTVPIVLYWLFKI
jgi:malonate transporter